MLIVKGRNIPFTLQLIKPDSTYETGATVSYKIYDSDIDTILIDSQTATYNETLNSYIDSLAVSGWSNQSAGNYLLVWTISDVDDFPSTMIEELQVVDDTTQTTLNVEKILGLVHHNLYIDDTTYDNYNNLVSARLRIYSDSSSVGTSNDVIATYRISCNGNAVGKFTYWKQVEGE